MIDTERLSYSKVSKFVPEHLKAELSVLLYRLNKSGGEVLEINTVDRLLFDAVKRMSEIQYKIKDDRGVELEDTILRYAVTDDDTASVKFSEYL